MKNKTVAVICFISLILVVHLFQFCKKDDSGKYPLLPFPSEDTCVTCSPRLYIPSAFTPNGDGLNDVFAPKGRGIKVISIVIFNPANGRELYIYKTPSQWGWDGNDTKGNQMPPGTYPYRIEYEANIGKKGIIRESVNLYRY